MSNVPTMTEVRAASVFAIRHDICQWGLKIASDDRYSYVRWKASESSTHTCPICKGRKPGNNFGWNCIGFGFATWHHGGGIASTCNCHVIDDGTATKMLKMSVTDMLKTAQKRVGIKDIKIIYNDGKHIPTSMLEPGDICFLYSGAKFQHVVTYIGNNKIVHCTSGGSKANQVTSAKYFKSGVKLAFRYTGTRSYISVGAKGDAVKKVQAIVGVTADGIFGEKTLAAVKKYQSAHDLAADGFVGAKTLAAMEKESKPEPTPEKKGYTGEFPSLALKKTNAEVIADTIQWAKWIAGDDRFHYGHGNGAHHNGCYFCKTQDVLKKNSGIVDYKFSYCCNPFVGAAWAHGGCDPTAINLCKRRKTWDFNKGHGYDASKKFTNLGHPDKSALKPGDVLCRNTHVALYIGGGKIAQAGHEDDNVKGSKSWNTSINIQTLTDKNYKNFPRVHRYNSSVDISSLLIKHGEVSYRVKQLQQFLNWFNGKTVCKADGMFGDITLSYVKAFQLSQKIAADGIVGPNTIAKMKGVVK